MKRLLVSITLLTVASALKCESLAVWETQHDLDALDKKIANAKVKYANDPVALDGVLLRLNTKKSELKMERGAWNSVDEAHHQKD